MDLREKIQYIIDNFEDGDEIVIFYTESTDNYSTVGNFSNYCLEHMNSYLKDYEEQGVVEDCDSEGVWFRFIDFELIKG
ncbi:hypothetical protein [Metabacillus fastidiosus]|uniref:hypothetical protein n=1 Tax=Metabacillus fastidiosus TaxID=1458 RepID=UPI003D2E3170